MNKLLAVDLGIKTGLALFNRNCKLEWFRSKNFGNKAQLGRAVFNLLKEIDNLEYLVVEGGGQLFYIWEKEARRRGLEVIQIQANTWRKELLLVREQRTGQQAKSFAIKLAIEIINQRAEKKHISLNDDAAEAILSGYWALKEVKWLDKY